MKLRINDRLLAKRTVNLHWFGNVRRTSHNSWRIRVGFECNGELFTIDRPLATLPLLRIGEPYHDGVPLSTHKKSDLIDTVSVPVETRSWSSTALQICRSFNYYLFRHPELINQRIHSFESAGRVFHIPHVELIRALFALHKPLSNAMLYPNGLAFIVEQYQHIENGIRIRFSSEVAATSLTEDFVHHVAWIISNRDILQSYESIFSTAYAGYHSQYGTPLSFAVPRLDNISFMFRGLKSGDEVLVLEILSVGGLHLDLHQIVYRHPSIKERTYEPGQKKRRIMRPDDEGFDLVDEVPKVDTHQPVVSHEPTIVGYTHKAEIVRVAESSQVVHQGHTLVERKGKGGALVPASVDESIVGGKTQPIDVQSLEVTNGVATGELREFLEMVRRLRVRRPELTIDTNILDLPTGRKFSHLPNGDRRKCAVVRVQRSERLTYILEVSRPDGHSLSTLLLYPNSSDLEENHGLIHDILRDLVYNQGYWSLQNITSARTRKLRHTHSRTDDWTRKVSDALT
ncbi:Tn7-like element transposition protein TnsE [Tumebacillus lipolyticus]|uniref:Tn7-like element transposition protein TnsE n=1 Tax=Tumebacillus lipolyticus TaxID=1280370 RepID=A0ABW4ZWU2_9BACL